MVASLLYGSSQGGYPAAQVFLLPVSRCLSGGLHGLKAFPSDLKQQHHTVTNSTEDSDPHR